MIRNRIIPYTACTLLIGMAFLISAMAQSADGSISGTVTDPSGAAIPGADVAIVNTATGVSRTLTTNDSGFFSVPNLLPGTYEVKTSAKGFGSVLQKLD